MDKNKLWQMAIDSGLCDRDLGQGKQLMTDYGDATDTVERFAEMVSAAEREECAKVCEDKEREFDEKGDGWYDWACGASDCAVAIRRMRSNVEFSGRPTAANAAGGRSAGTQGSASPAHED
jgi:hypothetical protein